MKEYLNSLKDENCEEKKDEEIENQIKKAESVYDRLDETVRRRIIVLNNGKETIQFINEVKLKIENVVESCGKDGILLEKANDELIEKIIDLEDRKRIRDIKPLQQQIDEINNRFNIKKNEWKSNLTKRKKEEERKRKEGRKEDELRKQETTQLICKKRKIEKMEKEQEEVLKELIIEKKKESGVVEIKQTKENTFTTIKVVLIGDALSDKNGLIMRYTTNKFPKDSLPTALNDHLFDVVVEGKKCKNEIWGTAGQENFDKIRNASYICCNVFILCYSICDRNSFENLNNQWLPEINNYCPDVPYILVGTKSESRYDESIDMNEIISE